MSVSASPFLTAEWRHLAMLNFEIDPKVLSPFVPAGTELDAWQGRTFVSIVGFLFLDVRVLGAAIPGHRDFEEVNLRFYVRRLSSDGWRRAVVFVKEIVPRIAIAWTARALFGENYVALPMRHRIEQGSGRAAGPRTVSYSWRFRGRENRIELSSDGNAGEVAEGSDEEFITEHTWGYARRRGGRTTEYRVEHPRWRVCTATGTRFDCDVGALYGSQFVEFLKAPPASAFLADGSKVTVFRGTSLPFRDDR
ncbi:MAG: YqjF family protein [Thermoanaerobaculia bacterium]